MPSKIHSVDRSNINCIQKPLSETPDNSSEIAARHKTNSNYMKI